MTDLSKSEFRRKAFQTRNRVDQQTRKSSKILARLLANTQFQASRNVLIYVSMRSEVQTHQLIDQLLECGMKSVYIPYCDGDVLRIFRLENWEQLERKSFGLLEPKNQFIENGDTEVPSIDLTIVPGVAFDTNLNRVGYGKGYYDRLLSLTVPGSYRLSIAFAEQVFESVPTDEHDIPMHEILTQDGSLFQT